MIFRIFLAAFILQSALAIPLRAQEATAVPDHVKKPLAAFLAATGWQNTDALTASAKYWQLTEPIFVIRVIDKTTCDADEDLCLTIVGGLRNGGFVSEAVFYAGARLETANNAFALGGNDGPSLFFIRFYGKKQNLTAMPAPTGWIVIPSASLDDFKGPKKN